MSTGWKIVVLLVVKASRLDIVSNGGLSDKSMCSNCSVNSDFDRCKMEL